MQQPRQHRFPAPNANGTSTHQLAIYDWGNPDATRVAFCVHGLTRNARDFDFLAAQLGATGRRVLAINMAGRGESDWLANPMDYHYATYVADCMAVMDNFHIREVDWIGTSMGGIIGMMIAAQSPQRIRKLVLNDIGAYLSKEALSRIYDYVRTIPVAFANQTEADAYLRKAFAPFGITDPSDWQHFLDNSLRIHEGTLRYACDPAIAVPLAAASRDFTEISDVNLSPIWNAVQTPTLIIRGAQSDVLSEETVTAMRSTNLSAEGITYPDVGHAPALMTETQTRPLLEWLDRSLASMMAVSF